MGGSNSELSSLCIASQTHDRKILVHVKKYRCMENVCPLEWVLNFELRMQVLQEGSTKPLAEHMTGQQYAWLQGHLGTLSAEARRASAPMMASFLTGCSEQGFRYSPDFYGCLVPYKEV